MRYSKTHAWTEQDQTDTLPMTDSPFIFNGPDDSISRQNPFSWCGPYFQFYGYWYDLYKDMSRNELEVFGHILRPETYIEETPLLTQGLSNQRLYFINKGHAKTFYLKDGGRIRGPELGPGDIIGVESFFCGSPSKYSVIADRHAQIDYLDKDEVMIHFAFVPGLIRRLKSFCLNRKSGTKDEENITFDKRVQKRYAIPGMTSVKLLDGRGFPTGKPFRGRLMDISKGGFAFSITLNEETKARRLIGRSVVSLIKVRRTMFGHDIFWGGRIVQVVKRSNSDYSIHLKGDTASTRLTALLNSLAG